MAGEMVILDTCTMIELLRGNPKTIADVYKYDQGNIFVTPVVVAELYRGARDKGELGKCRKLVGKFCILAINEGVVNSFSAIFDIFSLSHRPGIPDMLIAATALHYDIALLTENKKDFQFVPGIKLT